MYTRDHMCSEGVQFCLANSMVWVGELVTAYGFIYWVYLHIVKGSEIKRNQNGNAFNVRAENVYKYSYYVYA